MGPLGPFWPKSNEAKRGQGGSAPAPKARWVPNHKWAHLSQFWCLISSIPKWTKGPQDPNWPPPTNNLWQPPEPTSSGAARLSPN
ncbi:hypothetical protein O181_005770 [Austropuccinia psidii MF-1]|uniref:Uncharacterized protein n=1 Tax=Austropuccinia psidii MF-1 TaxID=1389203 RepID=A0A9Q3BJ09_9BASI|nr:hypothetical protein [Austropuccinia psidii MF-1]